MCPRLCLLLFALLFTLPGPRESWALDNPCRQHFQSEKYLAAARCFEKLVGAVDDNKQLSGVASLLKDRYLRNAAVSYSRAGDAQKEPAKRGYLKELAIGALRTTQQKGYCKATRRCERNKLFIAQLQRDIGYGLVVVVTGSSEAKISIKGYKYSKSITHTLNQRVRPGEYAVTVRKPGAKDQLKKISVKPNTSVVIDAKPAEIKIKVKKIIVAKKIPPLVLVGYIAGGVLIVGGAVLAALGYANQSALNTCRQDRSCAQDNDAYNRDFDQAGTLILVGYLTAATGALVLGGGAIAHVYANQNARRNPPRLKSRLSLGRAPTGVFAGQTGGRAALGTFGMP